MNSADSYHIARYRLRGNERYFIWYYGDPDGVVLSAHDQVAVFASRADLEHYAANLAITPQSQVDTSYDLDRLMRWLDQPSTEDLDCVFLLDAWNIFSDVAQSIGADVLESEGADIVYDKLFRGCNLPAMVPSEHPFFHPDWSETEVATLRRVLSSGLQVFVGAVGGHAA